MKFNDNVYLRTSKENDRLQSLCGAFDENIKLIEKEFNLNISRNNFTFTLKSNDENPKSHHEQLIDRAARINPNIICGDCTN